MILYDVTVETLPFIPQHILLTLHQILLIIFFKINPDFDFIKHCALFPFQFMSLCSFTFIIVKTSKIIPLSPFLLLFRLFEHCDQGQILFSCKSSHITPLFPTDSAWGLMSCHDRRACVSCSVFVHSCICTYLL